MSHPDAELVRQFASQLNRIEAKLDLLLNSPAPDDQSDAIVLSRFTPRQNAIIQMMLRDATVDEIARRLKVSTNTVKTHVTMIVRKSGVGRKSAAISKLSAIFDRVSPESYLQATKGLPKTWDADWPNTDSSSFQEE